MNQTQSIRHQASNDKIYPTKKISHKYFLKKNVKLKNSQKFFQQDRHKHVIKCCLRRILREIPESGIHMQ